MSRANRGSESRQSNAGKGGTSARAAAGKIMLVTLSNNCDHVFIDGIARTDLSSNQSS